MLSQLTSYFLLFHIVKVLVSDFPFHSPPYHLPMLADEEKRIRYCLTSSSIILSLLTPSSQFYVVSNHYINFASESILLDMLVADAFSYEYLNKISSTYCTSNLSSNNDVTNRVSSLVLHDTKHCFLTRFGKVNKESY